MKYMLPAMLLTCLFFNASAQTKVDDALLLDYYQNQRFADASDYLKTVYTEPVTNLKALSQLAYTSNMAGRLPEAEGYYQRIYDIDSTRSGVLFSLGSINLRRGNSAKAEVYYKRIAAKDTTNFVVYKQLAQISLDKGDIGSQIAYLQRANKINPADADISSDLANRYIEIKLLPQAENVLNKATTADPENIVLLESLMKLAYAQKKWTETVDACLKLMKNGNESSIIRTKLGVSYYNLKNYNCGAETFADIPALVQNEYTYYYAAMCYKALKDHKRAIAFLEKAINDGISTSIASYYGEIADSDEKLSKYKKAVLAYHKGLQFEESPMIYYSLASLYEVNLKDNKTAATYYKKYLASNPPASEKNYIAYAKSKTRLND
ncbi:tetratricopeptide repeat protein [Mucilaginibacter gilvus]|uniref:Uncharacterized protein n=1 Tax=Mucilaginibacter gilvus TaxID=2305909 RepID=A0A444MMJ8_9SPHI|nr:tetratricopeptide repeat protein [Mucilaginibacter gilvus]RWY50908.1 hypothetical protein EPL05_12605 [Mucilaginibacter gilvus]